MTTTIKLSAELEAYILSGNMDMANMTWIEEKKNQMTKNHCVALEIDDTTTDEY